MNSTREPAASSPPGNADPPQRPRVFVTRRIPDAGLDRLAQRCDVDVWPEPLPPPREELLRRIEGCAGVLSMLSDRIDVEAMSAAGGSLRVISNFAVGYNNIDVAAAEQRSIDVGNTPDVLTAATADLAVTLMLAAARRVTEGIDWVRQGNWKTWDPTGFLGVELSGKTLGIIGMGRIGRATAARLAGGWAMDVVYTSRTEKTDLPFHARRTELYELLEASDFVSIHTDLNASTRGMIDRDALAAMRRHAVLVNTSRGELVDQDALVDALRGGGIGAAGLDVTSPEPLPPEHPLVGLPNCTILPHVGSATDQSRDDMAVIAAENVLAGVQGRPLRCPVTA